MGYNEIFFHSEFLVHVSHKSIYVRIYLYIYTHHADIPYRLKYASLVRRLYVVPNVQEFDYHYYFSVYLIYLIYLVIIVFVLSIEIFDNKDEAPVRPERKREFPRPF